MPVRTQARRKTLRTDARVALETCVGLNARAAARHVTEFIEARLAKGGMSLSRFSLLAQIATQNDDSLTALAERTGIDQSTLSRNIKVLERDGLVEVAIFSPDQRRRAIWLTERGARALEAAIPLWREAQDELADHIDSKRVARLLRAASALPKA